ncbi:MAG: universal stress protein [Nocardioides sp.]
MEPQGREIVLVHDGSPDSDIAATWAAREASRRDGVVTVVASSKSGAERVRQTLMRAGAPAVTVADAWSDGPDAAVRYARQASMLVVGSGGHGRLAQSLLDSADTRHPGHPLCPLVVVRPTRDTTAHRIVVGVDGSAASGRAVRFACRQAGPGQETVSVLLAACLGGLDGTVRSAVRDRRQRVLEDVVGRGRSEFPAVGIDGALVCTDPGRALVDASSRAALVVVGTRGLTASESAVLGSVSRYVVHHAHAPVAVVH